MEIGSVVFAYSSTFLCQGPSVSLDPIKLQQTFDFAFTRVGWADAGKHDVSNRQMKTARHTSGADVYECVQLV